jgi:hypothetical protein
MSSLFRLFVKYLLKEIIVAGNNGTLRVKHSTQESILSKHPVRQLLVHSHVFDKSFARGKQKTAIISLTII